ncbi:Gfo/Idh/MocA family oxidoreductase [Candidatus Marinimicrobia bacterium]|nr:Gfo/Idh/MocA family oxidoreductase [Candidatus Neomarinimicrobiota bacterium]
MNKSILLFGVGYWGKNHLRELSSNKSVKSVFVVDPYYDMNPDLVKDYPDVIFLKSYDDFLNQHLKADGAIIATPPATHFEIAKKCLKNNLHVLIEKPMVETVEELNILKELAGDNKVLMSGHTYLYNPAIKRMKEIINSDEIGDIMFIHSKRLNFGIMREDTDVFLSLAPHDISLVQFFLNDEEYLKMSNSKSNFTFSPYDDFSSTHLTYKNNIFAQIDVSWYYPEKIRSLSIVGTKKTIVFDDMDKKILLHDISIDSKYNHHNNSFKEIDFDKSISPLTNEINHFLQYFDNPSDCITGYSHTKNVIRVLEKYYK